MSPPSRRQQLSDRLAQSGFVRNVVAPKVLKPVADWYEDNVDDSVATSGPEPTPALEVESAPAPGVEPAATPSASLASAQTAEAFFAGPDPAVAPSPRIEPAKPPEQPDLAEENGLALGRFSAAKRIALRVKADVKQHNLNVVAAGIAFWMLLAIPAVLTAIVSIYGLAANPDDVESQIEDVLSGASPEIQQVIGDQLSAVAGASDSGLAVGAAIGILLALWTASGAVAKLVATLNAIFGVAEDRKFPHLRGLALAITAGAVVGVVGAAFLLAALPAVLSEVGLGGATRWLLNIGRFPAMLVLMAVGLSVLYWIGPNRKRPYRFLTWGAVWATVLWLFISGLFTIYTASFASYNETYGSLGALVVLLLWLFITAFMVLVGAEIDAASER